MILKDKNVNRKRLKTALGILIFLAIPGETGPAAALRQYLNILLPIKGADPAKSPRLSMVVMQPRYFYCVLYPWSRVINPVYCMRQYKIYEEYVRLQSSSTATPENLGYDPGLIDPRAASLSNGRTGGQ
ncbi:uncharacterized protein [Dermacentor albipictus]|uniref:uncharacterized protein n=1 Tax=Dermacentor albipictus TaxID=60249 RepID=UPI0031FBF119